MTDCNAALFDVAHDFHGCIAGCHEVLRRQGLLDGTWCLDPQEGLSPGQAAELTACTTPTPICTTTPSSPSTWSAGSAEPRLPHSCTSFVASRLPPVQLITRRHHAEAHLAPKHRLRRGHSPRWRAARRWPSSGSPTRPINLIVPWAAGGSTDQVTRVTAAEIEKALGQKIVIVNQPGASGSIGTKSALDAPKDGYTWTAGAAQDLGTYQTLGMLNDARSTTGTCSSTSPTSR